VATTNIKTLNAMDATGDWSVTNLNAAADGQLARNVDYFEDEDITTAANKSVKFGSVGSSSGYAEDTISSTNLSSSDYLTAWVYATSSGNLVKFGFGESSATEQEKTITVQSSNTWQKVYWDISNISSTARDAVTKLRISILSTNTTVYIDSLSADRYLTDSNGSTISSTPNEYLQYRAILTTTNNGYHPTLHNVQIDWSNGFKIVQTDANTVRLYNFTGDTQQLRLDAVVFGADLAEWYTVDDQTIGDGDLVALTGSMDQYGVPILRRTTDINDRQIIGAISTKAGQTLGIEAEDRRLLALAGRVPVKMDLASPSLVAGDYLTSSDKPGFARKAKPGELTIGRAFETWHHEAPNATVLAIVQQPVETPEQDLSKAILTILKDSFELWDQQANVQITRLAAYSELVAGRVTAGLVTTDTLKVATLSPLATGSAITVNGPMIIKSVTENDDSPILIVDGELDAATISARTAVLDDISAQNITAKNIVADTIEANHIIGLDAKIASFSSELSDAEVETITTRIKNRLAILTGDTPTAQDIPAPPESLNTIELDIPTQDFATNSATLATASIDFATINNYLAVIGQATITNLDVTNTLYVDSINSKTGLIALGDNTLIIGAEGQVAINGDLTVSGKILASTAEIGSISLGNGQPSALGELLSIYNESGVEVATIDASGSANLATLTTNMITIASGGDATSSSLLSTSIATNATAGESVLISPNTDLVIESPHVTPTSLVYLTPTGNTDNKVLFVKSKNTCQDSSSNCQPSFTVGIDTPSSSDISFNWWIIGLK
nr:hypothetical protein [Candidatus Woesebacteria bacterium]